MRSFRSLIADVVFALALVALCVVGVYSYLNVRHLSATSRSVTDSQKILEMVARLHSDLAEIERGALGYSLTGLDTFLPPYQASLQRKDRELTLLREWTRDIPAHQATLDKLEPLVNRRCAAVLALLRARAQQGLEGARQVAASTDSTKGMDEIRSLLDGLVRHESDGLEKRATEAEAAATKTQQVIVLGSLAGLGLVAAVIFALKRDITSRHRAERRALSEHALMTELVDHIPDLIYIKDVKGRFLIVNRAYRKFLSTDENVSVEGKTVYDFLKPHWAEIQDHDEQAVVRSGHPFIDRIERSGLEEDARWFLTTKVPVFDSKGVCSQLIGIHRDITTSRETQEELKRARAQIDSAVRTKADFLANISHELRTPMNGIVGMTELVLDTEVTSQQREYLGQVKNSAQSLLDLLNNICDFSKSEEDEMVLENNPFDLHQLVADVVKPLRSRAGEKGLALTCRVSENVSRWLRGDAARLRQVLVNLIGNGIKFTEQGEVAIEINQEAAPSNQVQLQFSIRDTGIGVPEAKRKEIFEAFAQADTSHTRHYGGTGLGLTIASRVIQLMGGHIWLDSVEGLGSTFQFTAVFGIAEEIRSAGSNLASIAGINVLLVDPDFESRGSIEQMLRSWKMEPTVVSNGPAALDELWQAFQDGKTFPVVLVEATMPQMTGTEVAQHIKAEPELQKSRVILFSADSGLKDGPELQALGVDNFISKPIRQGDLMAAIQRAVAGNESSRTGAPAQPRAVPLMNEPAPQRPVAVPVAPVPVPAVSMLIESDSDPIGAATVASEAPAQSKVLKILVVDDNPVNQTVAVGILSKRGHTLFTADNGLEAVARYGEHTLDIVLMDIQMPEMDGLAATRAIRRIEAGTGRRVPIIAVTAHAMKGDKERCLARGMDAYLSKPVSGELLVEVVEGFGAAGSADTQTATQSTAASSAAPAVAVASRSELVSEFGDDSLVATLVDLFLDQSPKLVAEIENALAKKDAVALERSAHTLKGSVGNFRAKNAWQLAQSIEYAGRSGDISAVPELIRELTEELERVETVLGSYR